MDRLLVLFAREPARQARDKGFGSPGAAEVFLSFAQGWLDAARQAGACLVVATPLEDRPAWRQALAGAADLAWITQCGNSLGARLEHAARRVGAFGGHAVMVGGDVAPSVSALTEAFEALETGADAAVSPAPDGGISLVALPRADLDLLRGIRERRRSVLRDLLRALAGRGRRVKLVRAAADVDGRGSLRTLLRQDGIPAFLAALLRRALAPALLPRLQPSDGRSPNVLHGPPILRGPPLAV